jgi:hypothetical protein
MSGLLLAGEQQGFAVVPVLLEQSQGSVGFSAATSERRTGSGSIRSG